MIDEYLEKWLIKANNDLNEFRFQSKKISYFIDESFLSVNENRISTRDTFTFMRDTFSHGILKKEIS
ncbi:MAG: hypothetical protein MUF15_28270 [Acidobacteria bacterium]|jgi:hypothetical protein|nr:hypothetical protein [Acidobacteriota bacterium]